MRQTRLISFALTLFMGWGWINLLCLAQSGAPSLLWSAAVPVKRVEKPHRTPPQPRAKPTPKKPVVQRVPLLSLRWSVLTGTWAKMVDATRKPTAASPETTFNVGEHIKFVIEVNQDGYLYMIQATNLMMVFPDGRINDGKNFVKKGQKIIIPSNCRPTSQDANGNCWFTVTPDDDDLTLIFSRDRIEDLPNFADESGAIIVKQKTLAALKHGTRQQFSKTNPDVMTVQFTNLNRRDNEELIIETKIKHQ